MYIPTRDDLHGQDNAKWNIYSFIHPSIRPVALVPQEKNEDWQEHTEVFGNVQCHFLRGRYLQGGHFGPLVNSGLKVTHTWQKFEAVNTTAEKIDK